MSDACPGVQTEEPFAHPTFPPATIWGNPRAAIPARKYFVLSARRSRRSVEAVRISRTFSVAPAIAGASVLLNR